MVSIQNKRPVLLYAVVFFILGSLITIPLTSGDTYIYGGTGGLSEHNLNYHNDTNTTGASNGEVLKYNGTHWIPGEDLTGAAGAEVDPWFNASAAYYVTEALMANWNTSYDWGPQIWYNQDLNNTNSVEFFSLFLTNGPFTSIGNLSAILYNLNTTIGLGALTSGEVDQLENIGLSTISSGQWGYLGNLDQDVHRTSDPTFDDLTIDDLECQDINVNEASGDATIRIYPTTNNDADIFWYCNGDANYWRYYVNDGSQFNFKLDFYGGAIVGTLNTLYSKYVSGIPGYMAWGFAGETNPAYGTTLQNSAGNDGNDRAFVHSTYSDNRSKKFIGELPKGKLHKLCKLISIQMYYFINHSYDENGYLIFEDTHNTEKIFLGVDAQKLYYDIINTFDYPLNYKIAVSIVNVPGNENKEFWGVDYDAIILCFIQDSKNMILENIQHTKDIETFLSGYGYEPLPWEE